MPLALLTVLAGCSALTPYEQIRSALPAEELLLVGDQWVHVTRAGGGPPVVLLHGFGGSTYCWREVVPRLAPHFDLIALDLNGFGYTRRPRDPDAYALPGQANLVLGVLDALQFDSVHVVGHSYGGGLALYLAVHHPRRLRSLTVIAGAPPGGGNPGRTFTALFAPIVLWYVETFVLRPGPIGDALRSAVVDDALITPNVVTEYLARLRVEGFRDAFAGLTSARPAPLTADQIAAVSLPTLILWGERDTFVPVAVGQRLRAQMPQAAWKVFPNVGHLPMIETPDALAAELSTFLATQAQR